MSQDAIATWHPGELPLISMDTDSFDFASRTPRRPQFSPAVHDSAARDPAEAPSVSHADATDTDTAVPGVLDDLHNARIRTDVADALGANDSLSYHGMLQVLDAAAVGGMTAGKFHTLETLASLINAPDGISTSVYVQHVSHSLIDGDPANAEWTGGELTPVALGNLSATSTQAQVDDLIGKWFLGTDLPSMAGTGSIEATYEVHKGPLFAAHEAPSYLNVNQGSLGDCWFVATLAEVALQDPSAVESMITNNGNGTYGVRFFVDGVADYVTVNNELPTGNAPWANGSYLAFANGAKGDPFGQSWSRKPSRNSMPNQTPFTVKAARQAMPTRASRAALRRTPSQKSPVRIASRSLPTTWLATRPRSARRLTRARKWSSAPISCPRNTEAILSTAMSSKSSAIMQALTSSRYIILGARHLRHR